MAIWVGGLVCEGEYKSSDFEKIKFLVQSVALHCIIWAVRWGKHSWRKDNTQTSIYSKMVAKMRDAVCKMFGIVLIMSLYKFTYTYTKILIHICKYTHSYTCTRTNKHIHLHICTFMHRQRHRACGPLLYNLSKRWQISYCPKMSVSVSSSNVPGEGTMGVGHKAGSRIGGLGLRPSTRHGYPSERCQDGVGVVAMRICLVNREPNWARTPAAMHSYLRSYFLWAVSSQPVMECGRDTRACLSPRDRGSPDSLLQPEDSLTSFLNPPRAQDSLARFCPTFFPFLPHLSRSFLWCGGSPGLSQLTLHFPPVFPQVKSLCSSVCFWDQGEFGIPGHRGA